MQQVRVGLKAETESELERTRVGVTALVVRIDLLMSRLTRLLSFLTGFLQT
jgi:hypothetical protein